MEDARLLNVALNQIGGEWGADLLARLLIDLRATADRDLTLSGFAEADLQDLLTRFDQREKRARPERFDLDEALAAVDREASGIAPGAGWQLGAHRLFRGDATDAAFVAPWDRPGGGRDSMNQVSIKPGAVQQLAKGFVWSRRRARQVFTSSSWDASAHHCCGQAWLRSWSGGSRRRPTPARRCRAGALSHLVARWSRPRDRCGGSERATPIPQRPRAT